MTMTAVEHYIGEALRDRGLFGLSVAISIERKKNLTHFATYDMLGHLLDVYDAYGQVDIYTPQDVDFIAHKIETRLRTKFKEV